MVMKEKIVLGIKVGFRLEETESIEQDGGQSGEIGTNPPPKKNSLPES